MKYILTLFLFCFPAVLSATENRDSLNYAIAHYQVRDSDRPYLARVEDYLTGITTIQSDFIQVAPNGEVSNGKFYLKRPGQLRMDYDPPTPVLIVTNGNTLVYYDKGLKQVTTIPISDTLIGFLTRSPVRFDKTVKVVNVTRKPGSFRVTVVQASRPKDGLLTLEFSDSPLKLRNIVVADSAGQVTTVSLNNARFGGDLDRELFVFRDPRKKYRDR